MADCVDLLEIAKITDRFTGADLTNLMKKVRDSTAYLISPKLF